MKSVLLAFLVGAVVLLIVPQRLLAQTGPALLIKPWPDKGQVADGDANVYFNDAGHIKQSNQSFRQSEYESVGRFRILPGNEISPRIGYEFYMFDNHTHGNVPHLANQLTDESIAVGTGIHKWDSGWVAGITVGFGYAGSDLPEVGSGWYGKADFVFAREFSEQDSVGIILDYDGNRIFMPDVPLPGFGYSHRFDPRIKTVLGFPYTSVSWTPIKQFDFEGQISIFGDITTSASYEFIKGWSVFGGYDYVRHAFHEDGLGVQKRLLLYERRAETGIKYAPIKNFSAKVGVGYEWDGSYHSGWDDRRSRLVANFSDTPYIRAGLEWQF